MTGYKQKRIKQTGKMIIAGIAAVGLYSLLLTNQEFIIANFSKGGLYALLPISTAFLFSFVHGSFTGSFWTVLGVEAARKKQEVN